MLAEPLAAIVKDPSDRKFVAAAIADQKAPIVNASDTDWYGCQGALAAANVRVMQLIDGWCSAAAARKSGRTRKALKGKVRRG